MLVVGRAPTIQLKTEKEPGAGWQELVLGGGIRMRPHSDRAATVYFY
jgi:hypothetical protein